MAEDLIHESFPPQREPKPAHEGSQWTPPNFRLKEGFSDLSPGERGPKQEVISKFGKGRQPLPSDKMY